MLRAANTGAIARRTATFIAVVGLSLAWWSSDAAACRAAFDVGSSGLRVGSDANRASAKASVDYLTDVWADGVIDTTVDQTILELNRLRGQAGVPEGCATVGGGYSAWRLAMLTGGPERVVTALRAIHAGSGVSLFVMPQDVEGAYGYHAAKLELGGRLRTPLVWDIGGGSMQFASAAGGWGTALGQKAWRKRFCEAVKGSKDAACTANPVGMDARARARDVLAAELAEARAVLGTGFRTTGVSSPVVKGVHPILRYLAEERKTVEGVDADGFSRAALGRAIELLADAGDSALAQRLDGCRETSPSPVCSTRFIATAVTDMLLVHAFMEGLDLDRLDVAGADITNVAGMIADDRAYAWAGKFECYLARLRTHGIDAYKSDPSTCPR